MVVKILQKLGVCTKATCLGLVAAGSLFLTACSGSTGSSAIDGLLGKFSDAPVLSSVPTQIVQQGQELKVDLNNVKDSLPGNDAGMSYICMWSRETGGPSTTPAACSTLPGGDTDTFDSATGILKWTPTTSDLGQYKIQVTGQNKDGQDRRDFVIDVRLAFAGLESLTNIQGDRMTLSWTANPAATGYQVLKKNTDGTYSVFQTITSGAASTITLTSLSPLTAYFWRVTAIDTLGALDGNTVTLSAVTADLIRLEVTAAASQLSPGQTTSVTVRLKDNAGNYLSTSGLAVGVALSGTGTSAGTFSPVNDLGNGVYTSTFTATSPGTADTITASLPQFYHVETAAPIQVKPLQIEILASQNTLNPNQSLTLTAKIRDFTGALISWGGHGLSFSIAGGTSTANIGAATDLGTGTYSATLTGLVAGTTVTVGASISTTSTIYSTVTVQVVPYNIEVTSALADVSITRSTTVQARVKDWQGNYLTTGGQGLTFSVVGSAGIVTLGSTTDNANGTYSATVSGLSLGTIVISASMTPSFTVAQTATINVKKLRLEITSSLAHLMPGQTANLTGRVKDWQGNIVGVGGQSFDFSASGGTSLGTISAVTDNNNGVYNATFTASSAGTALTVLGSIADSYQIDTTAAITVEKWKLYVSVAASAVSTGQVVNATVTVKDYLGATASAGGQTISILQSGGTSTVTAGAVVDNNDGTYTIPLTGVTAGTATTISASITQSAQVMTTATLTVEPVYLAVTVGQASLNPGDTVYVYAQVQNSGGTALTAGSYSVSFSYSGGTSTGTFSSVTSMGSGLYRAQFTGATGGTAITISASTTTAYTVASTQALQVVPWSLEITAVSSALTVGQTTTLTGKVKDWQGHYLTSGGKGFAMNLATTGVGALSAVTDNSDGTYTATFSATGVGSSTLTASVTSSYVLSSAPTLTVTALHIALTTLQNSLNPGDGVTVTAQLKDANGVNVTLGSYTIGFTYSGGTSTGAFGATLSLGMGVYTSVFTGNVAGTAITVGSNASVPYVVDNTVSLTVVPWSLYVTAGTTTLTVGQSTTLTGKIKDWQGNYLTTGGKGYAMSLATTGVGALSAVTDNSDGTYTATFNASGVGSSAIAPSISSSYSVTSVPTLNVTALHIALSVAQNSLNPGQGVTVTAQLKDAGGSNVTTGSYTIGFTYSGGTSTGTMGTTLVLGAGAYSSIFTGNVAGTATTVTANASVPYIVDNTVNLTVVPWSVTISATAANYVIYETGTITAIVKDWQGTTVTTGGKGLSLALSSSGVGAISSTVDNNDGTYAATFQGTSSGTTSPTANMSQSFTVVSTPTLTVGKVYISVTLAGGLSTASVHSGDTVVARATLTNSTGTVVNGTGYSVLFSASGGSSSVAIDSSVTQVSTGVYEMTYRGVNAGTALTVGASTSIAYQSSATASLTITPGTAISQSLSSLTTSANTVRSGEFVTLTTTLKDAAGNVMPGLTGITFSNSSGAGVSAGTFSALTEVGNGVYTSKFTGTSQGTSPTVISVAYGGTTVSQTASVSVSSGVASNLVLAGPASVYSNACSTAFQMSFFDGVGNATTLSSSTSFNVANLGYGQLFSDSVCTNPISTVDVNSGASQSQYFYFRSYSPDSYNLTFSAPGITQTNSSYILTVNSVLSWMGVSGIADLFAGPSTGGYGSGNTYANGIYDGTFNTPQGISFYNNGSNSYLLVPDTGTHSIQKIDITNVNAMSIVGTIGRLGSSPKAIPSGGTNSSYCTGMAVSTGVNGAWCTGGQYTNGSSDAQFYAPFRTTTMTISGTNYLFVSDYSNHRIVKYNVDSGAYIGWTGLISSNTGMTASCPSATNGYTTPGWCQGGTAAAAANAGVISGAPTGGLNGGNQFRNPNWITNDGTYLYIFDSGSNRLVKLDPTTGLLVHWMGRIASVSVGGSDGTTTPSAINCLFSKQSDGTSTLTSGQFTPNWCSGGGSISTALPSTYGTNVNMNAHFGSARSIAFYSDGTYNWMVVGDTGFHRIVRYFCGLSSATPNCASTAAVNIGGTNYYPGQYFGWTGTLSGLSVNAGTPPASISTLFTATSGNATSGATGGWAYYGTSGAVNGGNGYNSPVGFVINGNFAYIGSAGNNRVDKMNIMTGAYQGWIGRVSTTPSGGVSGCAGANAGSSAPGWCFGGSTTSGPALGSFGQVLDLTSDGTYLYVVDRDNYRVTMHKISDGSAVGAIGLRLNNIPNVWNSSPFANPTALPTNTGLTTWYTNRDRVFQNPEGMTISGDYLYVSDTSNHRVKRYRWLDGSYQGWIGMTANQSPTGGDPNCIGSMVGGFTPGWCQGGGFTNSTAFGFYNPRGLAADPTYLYVADYSNSRVVRIRQSDGAFSGWIGYIGTTASDGGGNCTSGVSVGATGWCLGGASASSASTYALGGFNGIYSIATYKDADTHWYLIVADGSRLQKFDVDDPGIVSWVGTNNSGSTACGANTGTMVMSWCTTSGIASTTTNTTSNIENGYLGQIRGMTIDTSTTPNYIYAASTAGRILRFNAATGAFGGWIGSFGNSISNSACDLAGAAVNSGTPSWCHGGNVSAAYTGNGQFSGLVGGVYSDGTNLFVSDSNNHRVQKFNRSTGTFIGWSGRVNSATGISCSSGVSSGDITPSWCTGGTAKGGYLLDLVNKKAAFDTPMGMAGMGAYVYVLDSLNSRIISMPTN